MPGWHGQALEIDLASGRVNKLPLPVALLRQVIGGRGLAGHLLAQLPMNEDLPAFCLAIGPLCGSGLDSSARLVALFRSPLTGGIFVESAGCDFALALDEAGYDALLIKGVAPELSCLELESHGARLTSAASLAGSGLDDLLWSGGGSPTLAIGPAGENRVNYASVGSSQGENLERGGLGALWGRMNLKLLRAAWPPRPTAPVGQRLAAASADLARLYNAAPYLRGPLGVGAHGTAALFDLTQARRMLPTAYFQQGALDNADPFNAKARRAIPGYASAPCPDCTIACRKLCSSGPLPEYDSLAHFAALCQLPELVDVISAVQRCQSAGLDPASTAVCLAAYAMVEEQPLSVERVHALIQQVSSRIDEGAALADGSLRYLTERKRPDLVRCAKGLELPAYDPRGAWGMALSMAVSNSGDYRHAQLHHTELLRKPVPAERFSFSGKARMLVRAENLVAACDALCLCRHTVIAAGFEEYAAALTAVTCVDYSAADLAEAGSRIVLRERWFNQLYVAGSMSDDLPEIFFTQESQDGYLPALDRQAFEEERQRYYRLRGLDERGHIETEPGVCP